MSRREFHAKPFDESTLTKLDLFELYATEWLPVFLASPTSKWRDVHVFDFFAGPGADVDGKPGSPLRLLSRIEKVQGLAGWKTHGVHLHLFDADPAKIVALKEAIAPAASRIPNLNVDLRAIAFREALRQCDAVLSDRATAKLLFIDQFGVDEVPRDVFLKMVGFPTTDFLFFLSSSTLHRFAEHPAIKQKIVRPSDPYHVHRAALDYYRTLLPNPHKFYLAPFSIKKGSNIYGIIFGSAHPLGMDKFLRVAWRTDQVNGEADFDINKENFQPGQLRLPSPSFQPRKVTRFEEELQRRIFDGTLRHESDVVRLCFDHGVTRQHAKPVLGMLKKKGLITIEFSVPQLDRKPPRRIRIHGSSSR